MESGDETIRIESYFSLPTDLAQEMQDWPEFVQGQNHSVDLRDGVTGDVVSVRYVEAGEDCYVTVEAGKSGALFDRVVGRVVCALSTNSDRVLVVNTSVPRDYSW